MKKCPKCGTILDDSKKKCYMCGTVLDESNNIGFADAIDRAVGGELTEETDNIFNNGEDIKVKAKDIVKRNNNSSYYNENSDYTGVFSEELNRLTSIKTEKEEKSKIEKEDKPKKEVKSKKKDKEQANALKRQKLRKQKLEEKKERVKKKTKKNEKENKFFSQDESIVEEKKKNPKKEVLKPKLREPIRISKSFIFNSICIIIFVAIILFGYSHIKSKKPSKINLGGLYYNIDPNFKLASSDGYSRYYNYGDSCNIRITYGNVTNSDGFIDNYFNSQKSYLEQSGDNKAVREVITINDNIWETMKIVEFSEDTSNEKVVEKVKYRYNAIIYNANFYYIVFVNANNETTCSNMYNDFIETLSFEE